MVTQLTLNFEVDVEKIMRTVAKEYEKDLDDVTADDVSEYLDNILQEKIPYFQKDGFASPSDGWILHSLSDELIDKIDEIRDRAYDIKQAEKALHKKSNKDDYDR